MDQPPLNLPEGFPPDMPRGLPSMPFAMPMGAMSSASPMWQQGVHSARAHLGMFDQNTAVRAKRTREASVFESGSGMGKCKYSQRESALKSLERVLRKVWRCSHQYFQGPLVAN